MSRTRSVEADTSKVESYSSSRENVSNESPRRRHVWGISSVKGQPVEAEESKRPPRVSLAVGAPTCLPSWSVSFTQQLRAFWKATITVSNSCSIFRFRKEILFCPKSKVFLLLLKKNLSRNLLGGCAAGLSSHLHTYTSGQSSCLVLWSKVLQLRS
jgi:hypothetical protein